MAQRASVLRKLRREVMDVGVAGLGLLRAEVLLQVRQETGVTLGKLGEQQMRDLLQRWRAVAHGEDYRKARGKEV